MITGLAVLDRVVVQVSGRDAVAFLDSQLSQSLGAVASGSGMPSFLLDPDGKVVDLIGVHVSDGEVFLDVAREARDRVEQRLRRFLFRVDVHLSHTELSVCWDSMGSLTDASISSRPYGRRGTLSIVHSVPNDAALLGDDALELERIDQEIPFYGSEITDGMIPAELGAGIVAAAASFTKGCYTGQELVARLDARGSNVPFHLVKFSSASALKAGETLAVPGADPKATVTSAAHAKRNGGYLGLGFIHRTQLGHDTLERSTGAEVNVTVLSGAGVFDRSPVGGQP
jgi:folate-binding protein YgfZ